LIEPLGEAVEDLNVFVLAVVALAVLALVAACVWIKIALHRRAIRFSESYMLKIEKQDVDFDQRFKACMNEYQSKGNKLSNRLQDRLYLLSQDIHAQIVAIYLTMMKRDLLLHHKFAVTNIQKKWREQVREIDKIIKMKI
jgi:hypothetical protein